MHHWNPFFIALAVFAVLFGAGLFGLRLRGRLPENHLVNDSKDAVRLGMASVGTMAALVFGLLVNSTKTAYDVEKNEVIQMAAKAVWLDGLLANYGPEADECRALVRAAVHTAIERIWPDSSLPPGEQKVNPGAVWSRDLPVAIQKLDPQDDARRAFKTQAALAAADLGQMRWLVFEQSQSAIATPLLVMMVFWMALTYASIALFAPPNGTVVAAQLLAALAVAGALFLILELDEPFNGLIRISSEPMVNALSQLAR